ncbi:MAG TPA: hypothetical protein VNU20_04660 [Candidatus Sulfotelmatobacter sp.]|jgi:hypothetical protein|nr:hypothetical protein [Candidatus Sulfotelmatobacter sp.]
MTGHRQFDEHRQERGAALLIAIFALLLVSVVAIALIVSSGTDSALASNYRTSASAYYASLAGIEEARGRLLGTNPNPIALPATPMDLTQVVYIINPLNAEVIAPENGSSASTYPDNEYKQEFGVDVSTRVITKFASVSPVAGMPGSLYKWVRINAVTEWSLGDCPTGNCGTGVDVNGDGTIDSVTPLFYNAANMNASRNAMAPGLIETAVPPATAQPSQALEITSYAVLPNGSQKMLQAVVRPLVEFPSLTGPGFTAALTLAGNNVSFDGPGTSSFFIHGDDQCNPPSTMVPAIGYTSGPGGDANITPGAAPASNYLGMPNNPPPPPPTTPSPGSIADVGNTSGVQMNWNWLTPNGLDAVVQDITNGADAVINGPATPGSFPSGMSAGHPMTIVVNGDLDLNGWHNTGYGLLLVTGTLKYDPDASWQGVVLIIGQGNFVSTRGGTGEIDGAMFIAKTRDSSGNLLASLGASSFSQTGSGSNQGLGIRYNSCLARTAVGPITYKVLSFREIPLAN